MSTWIRVALSGLCLAGMSWGSLLTNGSFEDPVVGVSTYQTFGVGSTGITGWTVTGSGNVAVVSNGPICCGIFYQASDGNQQLDMSGTSDDGVPKGVIQSVTLDPGTYLLSFDVGNYSGDNGGGSPFPSTVGLLINGGLVNSYTNSDNTAGAVNWKTFTYSFAASGVTTVEFLSGATGADNYVGLDKVTLDATDASDAPEPATFAMLACAALLVTVSQRRISRTGL